MKSIADGPLLTSLVYDRLIEEIVEGKLAPGARIRQAALAERLGVSRAPVSHALEILKQSGLVQKSGRMGVEVTAVSPDRTRDLYQIRARIDGLAARLAAARTRSGEMPAADLTGLRKVFDKGHSQLKTVTVAVDVAADVRFHQTICDISGNAMLGTTMTLLWSHMRRAMALAAKAGIEREQAWEEHKRILNAIVSGLPDEAEREAQAHATNAGARIEAGLRGAR
jgi:DNA-binding GntR family transcriptional regulator